MATAHQIPKRRVYAIFRWVMRDGVRKAKREPYNIVELDFGDGRQRSTKIEPAGAAVKADLTHGITEEIYDDVRYYDSAAMPASYQHGTGA